MTKDQIKTGNDLYKYVRQLLEQKDKETQVLRENNPLYSIKGEAITAYPTLLNYLLSLWANAKEAMILENLISGIFGAFEWYAIRRSEIQSKFIETQLIITYFGITGKYPPGNTGEY